MSVLSDDYYANLLKKSQAAIQPTIVVPQNQPPIQQNQPPAQQPIPQKIGGPFEAIEEKLVTPMEKGLLKPYYTDEAGKRVIEPRLSQQDQIKKYGGVVGSEKYYRHLSENPDYLKGLGETLGMKFPDQETWDSLDDEQKAAFTFPSLSTAVAGMFYRLPRAFVAGTIQVSRSTLEPIARTLVGEQPTFETLKKEEPIEYPWVGKVPSIFNSYQAARDSGMGEIMASIASSGEFFGSAFMTAGIGEAFTSLLKPRAQLNGTPIYDTQPISQALIKTGPTSYKVVKPSSGGVGEYYQIPKTLAKKYGGSTQNTFFKVTPAAIDQTGFALSIVKLGKGNEASVGKFGLETEILREIIPLQRSFPKDASFSPSFGVQRISDKFSTEKGLLQNIEIDGPLSQRIVDKTAPSGVDIKNKTLAINSKNIANDISDLVSGKSIEAGTGVMLRRRMDETPQQVTERYINELLRFENRHIELNLKGKTANELDEAVIESFRIENEKALNSLLSKPLKGFENSPVTFEQVGHIERIASFNKIEPQMAQAVMRVVTGKDVVGKLTQKEYVDTSHALAAFNDVAKYGGLDPIINPFSQYLSPQRWWMRDVENSLGVPLYSKVYVPMENGFKLRNVFRDSYQTQAREIFGKYAGGKYFEERRLVKAYMEGDTGAITDNVALTQQVKNDLIKISDDLRPLYDKLGTIFEIPTEVFLKNYQPHIQDIGGIYQLYKQGAELPKEFTFFAEYKRNGSLSTQIDDSLALFDIYVNAGSNKMFINPALQEALPAMEKMPVNLQGSAKSYVSEKLGYAGRVERYLNEVGPQIAKRLGVDLPNDIARQLSKYIMDTTYAGALGARPDAIIRNMLQNPLMTYPRLGPKFYAQAVKQAVSPEGIREVQQKGFLVELGVPYGTELLKEAQTAGGVGAAYQKATQALLKPYSGADTFTRAATYWQGKYIWDDALARYSEGKITWDKFEQEVDFRALNSLDRDIIRRLMKDKKPDQAFDHFIRDVIDETQFPYRSGTSARAFYAEGKYLGQFGTWNVEFVHTIGNWVKTGQWDKLIRFGAAASATDRTVKDTFGIDVSKWVGLNVVSPTLAPLVQFGSEFTSLMVNALKNKDIEKATEDWEGLKRTLSAVGIPAGVEIGKIRNFIRSIELSKQRNFPPGQYGVFSEKGKLNYTTDFNDIFWAMFGFGSTKGKEEMDVQKNVRNSQFWYSQAKQSALELYQQQKYDEANSLIEQFGIKLSPQDFQSYYIPLNQRTYKNLPATLKAQFAPLIFK